MRAAHARDVIHRDFKPNNVLLREDGTPVLSDFGIAKSVQVDGTQTMIGVVVGSALYMAPEQALGGSVSNRVDIYSFGLVFYQMLCGALPPHHRTARGTRRLRRSRRRSCGHGASCSSRVRRPDPRRCESAARIR